MTAARPRRRRRPLRSLGVALAVIAVFVVGLALGQVLGGEPQPGPATTTVRTVVPLAAQTVTVTTTVTIEP